MSREHRMPLPDIRVSPFMRDMLLTTLTSVATVLAFVAMTRLLANGLGPEGFGGYSIARRILSTVEPVSTLAMSIAITRYIAVAESPRQGEAYYLAGLALCVAPALVLAAAGCLFSRPLTTLFFLRADYRPVFIATLLMTVGYSIYIALYSRYRGMGQMGRANLWQISVLAIFPLALSWTYSKSGEPAQIILWLGVFFFAAAVPTAVHARQAVLSGGIPSRREFDVLLRYGAPRVPGNFAFSGLLALGPFLAAQYGSLREAGYLTIAQSLLRLIEGATEAFGRVALPKISKLFADGQIEQLRAKLADIVASVLHVGLFVSLHTSLCARELTLTWLGPQYLDCVPLIRVMTVFLIPYLAFVTLRVIVDAIEPKAVNSTNLYIALAIATAASLALGAGLGVLGLAIGTGIGIASLGILTISTLWRSCRFEIEPLRLTQNLALNAGLCLVAVVARRWLYANLVAQHAIWGAVLLEALLALVYAAALWKLETPWVCELRSRISWGGRAR